MNSYRSLLLLFLSTKCSRMIFCVYVDVCLEIWGEGGNIYGIVVWYSVFHEIWTHLSMKHEREKKFWKIESEQKETILNKKYTKPSTILEGRWLLGSDVCLYEIYAIDSNGRLHWTKFTDRKNRMKRTIGCVQIQIENLVRSAHNHTNTIT